MLFHNRKLLQRKRRNRQLEADQRIVDPTRSAGDDDEDDAVVDDGDDGDVIDDYPGE